MSLIMSPALCNNSTLKSLSSLPAAMFCVVGEKRLNRHPGMADIRVSDIRRDPFTEKTFCLEMPGIYCNPLARKGCRVE